MSNEKDVLPFSVDLSINPIEKQRSEDNLKDPTSDENKTPDFICDNNVESLSRSAIGMSSVKKLDTMIPSTVSDRPDSMIRKTEINWQGEINDFDEESLFENLKNATEKELLEILKETEQTNFYLLKENDIYEFILNEDETVQNTLDSTEVDDDTSSQESSILTYPIKCYFSKKKLKHVENELELKRTSYSNELQNLKFELESLNISLKDLKESKEKIDRDIRVGGRHPVTKKVILQKVAKFFDDSIRTKMALTNRYKIQIQTDVMERNKILSQIKAQEKRLASLDMTQFQETQFEHKKSCRQLAKYKEQQGKFKTKFSPLLQSITEMKKALEREENEMMRMKKDVSKLEHLKEVMLTEKTRNDEKVLELKNAMRKIKLDPRRHNLPEVIDYAATKRENAALKKSIKKWKKKVELAERKLQKLLKFLLIKLQYWKYLLLEFN